MEFPPSDSRQPPVLSAGSSEENRVLFIADLENWMDENYLRSCFAREEEMIYTSVVRNKRTGESRGYAFLHFASHAAAESALRRFNRQPMPRSNRPFRIEWDNERRPDENDHQIFVGNLAPDISYPVLLEAFRRRYPAANWARVVIDRTMGTSKGYGFVRFGDPNERNRAVKEMNGAFLSTNRMRIEFAGPTKNCDEISDSDPNNRTLYVGRLEASVTEGNLGQVFSEYGELAHVKIHAEKRFGIVRFATRASAEKALNELDGFKIEGTPIRLSWGRSPSKTESPGNGGSSSGGDHYGYGVDGYDGYGGGGYYGYAWPYQYPNMYPAYAIYPPYSGYSQDPHAPRQL